VSEPDKGLYDALNKGVDFARGEWLYFIGADDSLKNKEVLKHFFSKKAVSLMLYGNVYIGDKEYAGKFSKERLFLFFFLNHNIFDVFSSVFVNVFWSPFF
jgi:glycosyltransferase involved in cell wall biosynthesis